MSIHLIRVVTFNANGIRSALRKGFWSVMEQLDADVICVQETKAHCLQLELPVHQNYQAYYSDAEKKGYSGVAIYSRLSKPTSVDTQSRLEIANQEGRFIALRWPNFNVANWYLPSGTSGIERQAIKYQHLHFLEYDFLPKQEGGTVVCGDFNIAHIRDDLARWKENQRSSGFLPDERAFLDRMAKQWVDTFRVKQQGTGFYTWWTFRAGARERNVGWRLDHQWVTPDLKPKILQVGILKEPVLSDHAPYWVDYDISVA